MKRWDGRCPTCRRERSKPGQHRAHACERQIVTSQAVIMCRCECQQELIARIERVGGFDLPV